MQTERKVFDDVSRMAAGAATVFAGAGKEARSAFKAWSERAARDLDLVSREEFEVVRAMAVAAREENAALKAEIEALKAAMARPAKKAPARKPGAAAKPATKKPTAKKPPAKSA